MERLNLPTIILRHRKENLKKCSLRGLENRKDFSFFTYPKDNLPELDSYVILALGHEELTIKDSHFGLLLIDSTWRYAPKMLESIKNKKMRSLPKGYKTAYPRYQTLCPEPGQGLASIEALYAAFLITNRDVTGLLDNYRWKEEFLFNLTEHNK